MNTDKTTTSVVFENFLLEKVEQFRKGTMQRSGHLSRSGAIRLLVVQGLESLGKEQQGMKQATEMN